MLASLRGTAETIWQVTCGRISKDGSLPLIHGQITTSPPNRGTSEPGRGSLTATRSRNGKNRDRVLSSGYMGNVSDVQRYRRLGD